MQSEVFLPSLEWIPTILKWVGGGTLAGMIGLFVTWKTTLPVIAIEGVSDKSKKFNSESRLKIKNIGKLDAVKIEFEVSEMDLTVGTNEFIGANMAKVSRDIPRLSGGESAEITVMVGVHFGSGTQVRKCKYILHIVYRAKFIFSKKMTRKWRVELRNFEDGFYWNATPST